MPSIAELLLAQGAQAAETRRRLGEISGQMWGNIGNTIAQIPGQVQQQQAGARRAELENMQLQQARQQQAGQGVLDRAMQGGVPNGPQEEGQPPAEAQHPYLDENGLWDVSKLQGVLADRGMAHLAPDLLKSAENINDSITKHQAAQQKEAETRTVLYGDLADGTSKLVKAGTPIDQAMDLVAAPALASKRMTPQEYQQLKTRILALPPDQQQAALTSAMDAAERVAPSETLAEGAKRVGRYGSTIASNAPKPPAPSRASIALQAAGGDPNAALGLMNPPKPEKEPKQYEVTIPGPHGPLRKLFNEQQMQAGVPSFQAPQQPVVVLTDQGPQLVNRGAGTAAPIIQAGTSTAVKAPMPQALQTKEADRKTALGSLDQLDKAIEDAKDFIGPGEGRVSTIEQLVGNPDPKLQALGTKMLITKMRVDAGIGGARAAASPQILARWDNLMTQKLTPEALHSTVQAIREILGETGTAKKMSAEDLIKKYGQ